MSEYDGVYREDARNNKCKWERAWGELNAALHADVDSSALLDHFGEDVEAVEQDKLEDIIKTFNDIAEKHGVETFDECWDGEIDECDDHEASP